MAWHGDTTKIGMLRMLHDLPSSLTPNWTRSWGQHSNSHLSRKSVPTRKLETGCCSCYQYGLILIQRFKTFKRHQKAIKDWSLQRRCQLNPRLSCLDFEHSTPPPLQGKLHWRWCTLRRMPRKAFAGGNKWEWSEWWCRMRGSKNWCRIHEDSSTFELGQKPIYCGLFGILTLLMLMLCWLMLCGWSWFFQVFSWESWKTATAKCYQSKGDVTPNSNLWPRFTDITNFLKVPRQPGGSWLFCDLERCRRDLEKTHGLLTADRLVVGLAQTPATTLIKLEIES